MVSSTTSPPPGPQSYALLLWVDPKTGRFDGSETILVPMPLAETINAARRGLYDKRTRADAWERACVNQMPAAPPEDDGDLPEPEDSAAQLRAVRETMPPRPAVPAPSTVAITPPTVRKRRAAGGQAVVPSGEVVQQLALLGSPRRMHKVLAAAIGRAVIGGRTRIAVTDLLDGLEAHLPTRGRDEHVH